MLVLIKHLLLVGSGGFVGAVCRYLTGELMIVTFQRQWIPYGTFAVNVLGCFAIGVLGGLGEVKQSFTPELRLLLIVGFLGGFTTFSSYGYEQMQLFRGGHLLAGLVYAGGQLVLGLLAVWAGYALALSGWPSRIS